MEAVSNRVVGPPRQPLGDLIPLVAEPLTAMAMVSSSARDQEMRSGFSFGSDRFADASTAGAAAFAAAFLTRASAD